MNVKLVDDFDNVHILLKALKIRKQERVNSNCVILDTVLKSKLYNIKQTKSIRTRKVQANPPSTDYGP